jgi:hypothetical protein
MILGKSIVLVIEWLVCHFGLGVFSGFLVVWLVWRLMPTIFLHTTDSPICGACGNSDRFTYLWLSLLVVSVSIVTHVLEDYLVKWF